jgi:hypothetical protein
MSTTDTAIDIVHTFTNALEANDLESAASKMANGFTFSGWTPEPLAKQNFLGVIEGLKAGIPNLKFNLRNLQEHESSVTGTIQVTGYQSNSFVLPPLGLPPIPQMAGKISLPPENISYTVANGLIERINVQNSPEGGIRGILRQLGTDSPIVQ